MVASMFVLMLLIAAVCLYLVIRAVRILLSPNKKRSAMIVGFAAMAVLIIMIWFPYYYMNHTYMK